jgi:F-type H+-transporting ATPase subunit alpha
MPVGEQVALLYCGTKNLLQGIAVDKVVAFEKLFLDVLRSRYRESVIDVLSVGRLNADVEKLLTDVAADVVASMK